MSSGRIPSRSCRLIPKRWLAIQPARLVGGRERVVGPGEDDLVQAAVAHRASPLQRPADEASCGVSCGSGPSRATVTTSSASAAATRVPARPARAKARRRVCSASAAVRPGRPSRASSSPAPKNTSSAPAPIAAEAQGQHRLEHDEDPQPHRARAPDRPPRPRARRLEEPVAHAAHRALDVLGVERRGGGADHEPEQPEQQRPREQVAEVGLEDALDRGAGLLVGHRVVALDPRERASLERDQRDGEHRARDADGQPAAEHRDPPVGRDDDRGDERQHRHQRQHDAEHPHRVGRRQGRAGEVAPAQRPEPHREVLRELPGEARRDRARPKLTTSAASLRSKSALRRSRTKKTRFVSTAAERNSAPERVGLQHALDHRLEQRPRGDEVGGAAVDEVDDDLPAHELADIVVLERRHRAVGERVAVDHLLPEVEGDRAEEDQDRADHDEPDARHGPRAFGEAERSSGHGVRSPPAPSRRSPPGAPGATPRRRPRSSRGAAGAEPIPSSERMRSEAATSCAGSPSRRSARRTGMSRPVTARAVSITSRTEKPWPLPRL